MHLICGDQSEGKLVSHLPDKTGLSAVKSLSDADIAAEIYGEHTIIYKSPAKEKQTARNKKRFQEIVCRVEDRPTFG
jgi:hypothetical protein